MKENNRKKRKSENLKLGLFQLLIGLFSSAGHDEDTSYKRAYHQAFVGGGNPEYSPRKHTVRSYATQNRIAKKRRKFRAKSSKR